MVQCLKAKTKVRVKMLRGRRSSEDRGPLGLSPSRAADRNHRRRRNSIGDTRPHRRRNSNASSGSVDSRWVHI